MKYVLPRNHTELGDLLAKGRIKKGLTQRVVSQKLGYSSAQFISNFERGICAPPLWHLPTLINMYGLKRTKVIDLILKGNEREYRKILCQ